MGVLFPDSIQLRDYQDYCYKQRLTSESNIVICIPTGGGKGSIIARQLIDIIDKKESFIVICPTEELVNNIYERVYNNAPQYAGMIHKRSGNPKNKGSFDHPWIITTFQTLYRKLGNTPNYKHVIFDECHMSSSPTALSGLNSFPDSIHTGYTATPGRLDNKPLDYVYSDLIMCPLSTRQMIDRGYLADFSIYGLPIEGFIEAYNNRERQNNDSLDFQQKYLSNNRISEQIYQNWAELAYGDSTIGFASSKLHCEMLTELFNSKFSEKRFAYMHNGMNWKERKPIIDAMRSRDLLGVFNVNMLCTGVDIPEAKAALLVRKTQSFVLHNQQIGRVLRPKQDGSDAKIIDMVGNTATLGSPTYPREWSLQSDPDLKINDPIVVCPRCDVAVAPRATFVRELNKYWSGINSVRFFTSIGNIRVVRRDTIYGEREIKIVQTEIYCDHCNNNFKRRFEVMTLESDPARSLVIRDDSLGSLEKINTQQLDRYLLNKKLEDILNSSHTTQVKRDKILRSKFHDEDKVTALVRLGESRDTAKMLVGIE